MARYENALSTLQARTLVDIISRYHGMLNNKEDIKRIGKLVVKFAMNHYPKHFPKEDYKAFLSFSLSATATEAVKRGDMTVLDYIAMLAETKEENEKNLSDYGAFGDLYEILIRCAFISKISLVRWTALHIKDIKHSDMVSKKYGITEIGHNGKTLSFGTLLDYMSGDYTSVVYGVFSDEDKKEIYSLCKSGQYKKVMQYVKDYSVYWSNKYDFQKDMDSLTAGKGITAKTCGVQVVYNTGKYNAFVSALNNGIFKSLAETLKK